MSMNPVTPERFNSVLAGTMAGGIVTAQLLGSVISGVSRYRWVTKSSASYCRFIIGLSAHTHTLTLALAGTFSRPELRRAQESFRELADDSHAYLEACFEPHWFREVALDRLRHGRCPKVVAHECVSEHFPDLLDFLDRVQSVRMNVRSEDWRRVEAFKQDLVNYWGQNGFDIARSYGREYNYCWRAMLRVLAKCVAYPLFGLLVVGSGLAIALTIGI